MTALPGVRAPAVVGAADRRAFAGRVVVVTGASAGIGRAVARAFGAAGARVALLARGAEGLAAAAGEIAAAGGEARSYPLDVADASAVEAAAGRIEAEMGEIAVWVNDAMATIFAPVERVTAEEYRRVTEVTYLGAVYGTQAALKRMRPRDRGAIVQVGSALAYRSIPLQSAYCGAKAALRGFTDSLRCELIHDDSRLTLSMVQLSGFNTPQFDWARNRFGKRPQPVPPAYQPEIAAAAVLWAARHARREVWVGLPAVQSILGTRLLPALLDRMMARKAYEGQLTQEDEAEGRPDNLFEPVAGDFGAHGRFDARARPASWQLWCSFNHGWVAAAAAVAAGGLFALAAALF